MAATVAIDLSAKIEQWGKDTALVFSNGISGSILITKKDKRAARKFIEDFYQRAHSPSFYVYQLLSACVYVLILPYLSRIEQLQLDIDYPGVESKHLIKVFLLNLFHRDDPGLRKDFVVFRQVKGLKADWLARNIFKGQVKPDRKITWRQIADVYLFSRKETQK